MPLLPHLTSLWRNLFHKDSAEEDLTQEIHFYLELLVETKIKEGLTPKEARRAALMELGGVEQVKESVREIRTGQHLETLWQDFRYGVRMLRKKPAFTLIVVITLAFGIGANTAIFSVVNALLLQPLPFAEAERLVWIGGWLRNQTKEASITPADFLDYREQSQSFAQLAASISETVSINLTGSGEPERLKGAWVTANYLDIFGVQPALGRIFSAAEEQERRGRVVVLSFGFWERRFGADPAILNQTITLDGNSHTVIGVMPPQFRYPPGAEVWIPFSLSGPLQSPMRSREFHFLRPIGRLKRGVSVAQARTEVETIARRLEAQYPKTNKDWSLYLIPLQERFVGSIRLTLFVLLGAVGCVLLIACVNVANLLLARAASRQKEIAVRGALGAGRGRILRQLLTESVTLALVGGLGGVLVAQWGVRLLVALGADSIPRAEEIGIHLPVLGFTLAVALVTGLLFGLAPAVQCANPDLTEALKEGGRSEGPGRQHHYTLNVLIVGEVALAAVLLIGAGLLVNSFVRLQQVEPGFDEKHLLTMRIDLPNPYAQPEQKAMFFQQLQQRLAALPGVETVGLITELPLARQSADARFRVEGRSSQDVNQSADIRSVNHEYFRAMRIPLRRGRFFTEVEVRESARVVVISEVLARRFFAGEDPMGRHLRVDLLSKEVYEIIGVVGDVRHRGLDMEPRQTIYYPTLRLGWSNLVFRTATDPTSLAAAVRKEVAALDPNQPIANVKTMEQWVWESVAQPRFRTWLLGVFSALALLLSIVGIYGVMSYAVTQRTHELGMRMALGAQTRDVLKLVVAQGMKLTLVGVAIGLAAAFGLTRVMETLLYEVSPTDPLTFALVSLLLAGVALVACFAPARRAAKVDPMVALRYE